MAWAQWKSVSVVLLAVLLAGCVHHEMNAREATEVANNEVSRMIPEFDRSSRTIRADDGDGHWSVYYESADDLHAGGPVIVQVDKRTRRAAIVQMPQ
jgi:hypothetical protein